MTILKDFFLSVLKICRTTHTHVPDFDDTLNVCDPIGVSGDVFHDRESNVPVQQVGLVIMINVLPR